MSHIVEIQTQVKDVLAIRSACQRLQLDPPQQGTFQLFGGKAVGYAVQLPAWRYPVVANLRTGELKYDNFQGRWGDAQHLDRFLQAYAVEKAKLEARKHGHTVTEQSLPNGSIQLEVQVTGGGS